MHQRSSWEVSGPGRFPPLPSTGKVHVPSGSDVSEYHRNKRLNKIFLSRPADQPPSSLTPAPPEQSFPEWWGLGFFSFTPMNPDRCGTNGYFISAAPVFRSTFPQAFPSLSIAFSPCFSPLSPPFLLLIFFLPFSPRVGSVGDAAASHRRPPGRWVPSQVPSERRKHT